MSFWNVANESHIVRAAEGMTVPSDMFDIIGCYRGDGFGFKDVVTSPEIKVVRN